MEKILSRNNELVKQFVRLSSSKKEREESESFAIESVKLVHEAVLSNVHLQKVLFTQSCLNKHEKLCSELLKMTDCFLIDDALESKLSSQKTPQGIYAIGEKLDKTLSLAKIRDGGCYVMLCELQDAGNVGAIFRTAEALGIDGVIMTQNTCDYLNPKVIRGSMGSVFRMPVLLAEDAMDFVSTLNQNAVTTYASVVDTAAPLLTDVVFSAPSVILIGNEGNGLDAAVVELCAQKLTIHMKGRTESLNASMAACILLWEMSKQLGCGGC